MINTDGIKMFDSNGIEVNICRKSQFKFVPTFKNPSFYIDNFEKTMSKHIEIKRIDLQDLERYGYRVVALRAEASSRWYARQSKIYMLENKSKPIPRTEILTTMPKEHSIELDVTNNRIRLKGKNAGYPHVRSEGASRWIEL